MLNVGDIDLLERIFASSPPLLLLSMICVVILWRKLEQREARMDALNEKTVAALHEVSKAVQSLTDEIHSRK